MTLNIDNNGTIFIHQGDTGEVIVSGLNTDKNYKIYFAIQNAKRESVCPEIMVNSDYKPSVTFFLSADMTNLLSVPDCEEYEVYHYGLKSCFGENIENTLQVKGAPFGRSNNIVVFPKRVEGI